MSPKPANPSDDRLALSEKTSQTDDQRIQDVTPLPPPEHLIRFFPIADTPLETLIKNTRGAIRNIMSGEDDRLLVIVGPCSIHDPAAALEYARKLKEQREQAVRVGYQLQIAKPVDPDILALSVARLTGQLC